MKMNYWKYSIWGLFLVSLISCSKGDDQTDPEPDPVNDDPEEIVVNANLTIKGNVTIFDQADDDSILNVDDNNITLQDNAQDFEVGDVIVAGISTNAPRGFLREITSIQASAGELRLQTRQAKLTDAIKEGSATYSQAFELIDFEKSGTAGQKKFDVSLTLGENSPLSGSLSVDPTFIFDLSISNFQVQTARFGLEVDYTAQAVLNIVSEATTNLEKELIERDLKPITIFIGGVFPLVITPEFEVTAGLEYVGLNIATQYTVSGESSLILERIGGNWETIKTDEENPSTAGISASLGDEFTSYIQPGLEISFYNLSQLETDFFIKKSVTGKMIQNGENLGCTFNCALAVGGAVEIDILGLEANPSIEATIVEFDPFYECPDNGLPDGVGDIIPDDILDTIEDLDMPINTGFNPPFIEGNYFGSPMTLKSSNVPGDSANAAFADLGLTLSNQKQEELSIVLDYTSGPEVGTGLGSFVSGEGDDFSVFAELVVSNGTEQVDTALLLSGTKTPNGIQNLHFAVFMIDNKGNPTNTWIPNGTGRVIIDGDAFSPGGNATKGISLSNQRMVEFLKRKP